MKRCKVCGETKPYSEFHAMAQMRDGYRNDCEKCHNAAKAARNAQDPQALATRSTSAGTKPREVRSAEEAHRCSAR